MTLGNGGAIKPARTALVAGWATVGSQPPDAPLWDVVAEYLRDRKTIKVGAFNTTRPVNVPDYPGDLV